MKKEYLWLALIIIIAAYLRLANLQSIPPGLYPDEAMNGNNALEAIATGNFKIFYPENGGREGLFINIQAIFLSVLGNEPWVLRLPSAIFGILTVLGVYFLTKELFGKSQKSHAYRQAGKIKNQNDNSKLKIDETDGALINQSGFNDTKTEAIVLLSTFLLATSFWHINFSRIGFRAIMAPAFLVWGVYFLLSSLNKVSAKHGAEEEKTKNRKSEMIIQNLRFIIPAILGGVFYGLGFHSYIAYRATPVLICVILFLYWLKNKEEATRSKILLSAFCFLFSALVVFAPLGFHFLGHPEDFFGRTSQISVFNSGAPIKDLSINALKTLGMFNFVGDFNWRHNIAGEPLLFWPVGILFIVGVFLAMKSLIQNLKFKMKNDNLKFQNENVSSRTNARIFHFPFSILLSWLIIAALPVIISNEGLPHALRAILMAPAVMIISSISGAWICEKIKSPMPTGRQEKSKVKNTNQKSKISNLTLPFHILVFIFFIWLTFGAYKSYFVDWGQNQNVQGAFSADYVEIGRELNGLPKELPKYVIIETAGAEVRGVPMRAQTVMFITDTFRQEEMDKKNIHYIVPGKFSDVSLPKNAFVEYLK